MAKRSTKVEKDPFEVLLDEFRKNVGYINDRSKGIPYGVLTGEYINVCDELVWYIAHSEKLPDNFPKSIETACRKYYTFEGRRNKKSLLAYKTKIYNMLEIFITGMKYEI